VVAVSFKNRWATLLITGMAHLKFWKIMLADGLSAIVTVSMQVAAGYYLSKLADSEMDVRGWMTLGGIALATVLIVGYVIVYRRKRGGRERPTARLSHFRHLRRRKNRADQ